MKHILELLDGCAATRDGARCTISWSATYREGLRRVADGNSAARDPVERALAPALLMCAEGRFVGAEQEIIGVLRDRSAALRSGWPSALMPLSGPAFTSLVNALFTVQRFDLLAAMLHYRYRYPAPFEIGAERGGPGLHCVTWTIPERGPHRFIFDAGAFESDRTWRDILFFQWVFPLCSFYASRPDRQSGSVVINLGDLGGVPGLAFCDNRPDRFLVPDRAFIPTRGYAAAREAYKHNCVAWADREPVAYWRGSTTGMQRPPGEWRSLDRIKLCQMARSADATGLFDVGISGIVQFDNPAIAAQIEGAGLVRDYVPWRTWTRYRFHIDIDGNTNSWAGFFYRLLTGSPVLKIESARGFVQWFYDRLVPWQNFVPVAPDMSDLIEKVRWLARNDTAARQIGDAGRRLAEQLTYEGELARAVPVITAAFQHAADKRDGIGPFGRAL